MKELHQILKLTNRGELTHIVNKHAWQVDLSPIEIKITCSYFTKGNDSDCMNWRFIMWNNELIYVDGFPKKELIRLNT